MGKQKPKFDPSQPFDVVAETTEAKPKFDPSQPFTVVEKKSANENGDGSKDLSQPAKQQKPLSESHGSLLVDVPKETEVTPVVKPKDGKVDFSKDKIDNGFFSSESTAPIQEPVISQATEDFKATNKERADELKKIDNGVSVPGNFIAKINQQFYGLPATVLESMSMGGTFIHNNVVAPITGQGDVQVENDPVYKAAQWYREAIADISPTNPAYANDLDTQVAGALGDLGSLVISGGTSRVPQAINELQQFSKASNLFATGAREAGKLIKTPPALVGAMQMGTSEYKQAKESGATDDEAFGAFIKNAGVGSVLEAIPIMKFFSRLDKTTGGGVKQAIQKGAIQGVEEMTTEVAQQVFSNVSAGESYDTARNWYDGLTESGGIGFGLGFALGAMGASLRKKHSEAKTPEEKAEIQKAIDFVDSKGEELKIQEETKEQKIQESYKPGDTVELSPKKNEEINTQGEATENSVSQQVPISEEVASEQEVKEEVKPVGIEAGLSEEAKSAIDNEINFLDQEQPAISETQELEIKKQNLLKDINNPDISEKSKGILVKQLEDLEGKIKEKTPVSQEGVVPETQIESQSDSSVQEAAQSTPLAYNKKVSDFTDALKTNKIDFTKIENSQDIQDEIEDIKFDASFLIDSIKSTKERLEKKKKLTSAQQDELDSAKKIISNIPEDYQDYSSDALEFISKHGEALSKYDGYSKIAQRMSDVYDTIQSNEFAVVSSKGTGDLFNQSAQPVEASKIINSDIPPAIPVDTQTETVNEGENQDASGIKKSLVSDDIIASVDLNKIGEKDMHSLAAKIIDTGEVNPEAIVNEILGKPRALQPKEVVALIYYKAQLDNRLRDAYKEKNRLFEAGEETGTIDAEINTIENDVQNFDIVAVITASQQSLAFRLRKGMLDKDYNLVTQINKYKSVNKGVIPPDVEAKFKELDKRLKEVNEQLEEAEKRAKIAEDELALKNIKESIAREKVKTNIKAASKDLASKIRKAKFHKPGIFSSATPVTVLVDLALETSASIIEAGGTIAQAVSEGWAVIKASDWYKGLNKNKQIEAEKAFAEMVSPSDVSDERLRIPNSIIRQAVEEGNDTIEDVTKYIKGAIKEDYPNITDREVRDAITKYGKVANMSKDEIDIQIRKIKRIGKIISSMEDVANKKRPLRSGLQRDKLDAEERALNKQLKEGMRELPFDAETEARQLKTSLDAVKSRLTNQIEDLNREIETGEKSSRAKGVPYDQEAKALIEERDRIKALHDEVFGKNELTDEQKIDRAIKSTERSIAETERRIAEKDLEIKKSKPVDSTELKTARERLNKSKETLRKLQEDAGIPAKKRLEQAKKAAQKRIDQLQEKLKNNDFSKRTAKPLIADTELTKLQAEKLKIQDEFNKAQYKNELKNRTLLQKWGDVGLEVFSSLWRGLAASMDLSAVFVQGLLPTVRHPKDALYSLKEMFKQLASEKYQAQVMANIKSQEWYPALKASKLAITEIDGKFNAREELFVSNWIDAFWDFPAKLLERVIKQNMASDAWKKINPYKAANRAYTGYLNSMRILRFLDGAKFIESQGKTFDSHPEEYKAWADYVNNATGRGGLGPLENSAKALSLVFFSPRKLMSGLNLFSPYTFIYFGKMPKSVRQKAIMDYAQSLAILTTTAILWEMAIKGSDEDDEEDWSAFWDTRSSDFLKPKIENTRIDLFGGKQQQLVAMSRLITGEFVDSKGEATKLGDRFGKDVNTRWDVAGKFFSNKFTPSVSFGKKVLDQKKGSEVDWEDESIKQVMPIWIRDVQELYKDHPIEIAIMLNLMIVFGLGVQTYGTSKRKQETPEERKEMIRELRGKEKERIEKLKEEQNK